MTKKKLLPISKPQSGSPVSHKSFKKVQSGSPESHELDFKRSLHVLKKKINSLSLKKKDSNKSVTNV